MILTQLYILDYNMVLFLELIAWTLRKSIPSLTTINRVCFYQPVRHQLHSCQQPGIVVRFA